MDEERVGYSFTGDVTSLRSATKEAINLLNRYEGTIKKLASSDKFQVGKTAFTGFQRTVNGLTKQVNSLSHFMNTAPVQMQKSLESESMGVQKAVSSISDSLTFLQNSTSLTTEDVKLVTMYLREARDTMDTVSGRAQALGTSFERVAQLEENTARKSEEVSGRLSSASLKMLQTKPYLDYAKQVDQTFNHTSKSARESMKVFARANELRGFVTAVDKAADRVIAFRERVTGAVQNVRNRFAAMAKVFDPIKSKMQSLKDKTETVRFYMETMAEDVARAFRRVVGSTKESTDGVDRAARSHRSFGTTIKGLVGALGTELRSIGSESKALSKKNSIVALAQRGHEKLSAAVKKLGHFFRSETSRSKRFGSSLDTLHHTVRRAKWMLGRLVLVNIGKFFAKGITESINFTENLNLFRVAMGDTVDQGLKFVNQMSEIYGMDPSNLYKTAGYFYQLTDAIGMTDQASSTLSLSLTKASNDIASLFNVDVQTVVDDLASGMQGMSRSVRKYGMDIRATTLQQTALTLGIQGNVETMSEADRMALRFITMMNQVTNATSQLRENADGTTEVIGDFAKTIEQPANQLSRSFLLS